MILFKAYPRNFSAIQADVDEYMPYDVMQLLDKGISNNIQQIILEAPYVDKDFRDTYYNDFSKRFTDISRDSIRLHLFFSPDNVVTPNYGGFITLRDTKIRTIGRSYIAPKALNNFTSGYCCLAKYEVNYRGQVLEVEAFPWMQQDGNVSRCAHIAAWSINRYYSQRYCYYAERTLHEITTHDSTTRRVPSRGASVNQIAQILQKNRFDPEIYIRDNGNKEETPYYTKECFNRLMHTFVESGIPFIAGVKSKHAIVIIGHGELSDIDSVMNDNDGLTDSYEFIENLIIVDDTQLPYTNVFNYEDEQPYAYIFDEIDVLIVPFYEKMYLDVDYLYSEMLPALENNILKIGKQDKIIRRVFLTSSRSFKKYMFKESRDSSYRELMLLMQMPKFIWVAEYSSVEEFKKQEMHHRIILDATTLKFQVDAYMAIKKDNEVAVNNKSLKSVTVHIDKMSDVIYQNLGRIK
ncbi:MAG: hypothetical protein A2X79_00745 [Desulfuromonadaceae bacterium GWB2_53_15]|nr:MAG: hypothetical protein A2X79_00745 [Desulfuromonadaceae bacterium GWB2_53_15]